MQAVQSLSTSASAGNPAFEPERIHTGLTDAFLTVGKPYERRIAALHEIPPGLRDRPIWCAWKLVHRAGKPKPDKVPVSPKTGETKAWTKPGFATDAKTAVRYAEQRQDLHGVGIILGIEPGLAGGDLDGCVDASGKLTDDARRILETAHTYTELSPSLGGVRFLFLGSFGGRTGNNRERGVEFYEDRRFLTFTGRRIDAYPGDVEERDLSDLGTRYFPAAKNMVDGTTVTVPDAWDPVDLDRLDLSEYTVRLIREAEGVDDRSTGLFGAAKDLMRAGCDDQTVLRILADPDNAISEGALDRRAGDIDSAMQWLARYTLPKARKEVEAELAQTLAMFEQERERVATGLRLTPITVAELSSARITPREILPRWLYADVRTRVAAGGTGKTTVALYEAVTLALGRPLWGRIPEGPMRTVLVSREDSREILVARMRQVMCALALDAGEQLDVLDRVRIVDLSGVAFRLSSVEKEVVQPHRGNLDALIAQLQPFAPDWLVFDPMVSFGVGESRVNDAEQGLIEAARVLRNALNCCVELIHHTGKANAREATLDQYSGRGGSALADGARMVCVMQPVEADRWIKETGETLAEGEQGLVMATPKLSFSPSVDPVYVRRRGYHFEMVEAQRLTPQQAIDLHASTVGQWLREEFVAGRKYSKNNMESCADQFGLSRERMRNVLVAIEKTGIAIYRGGRGVPGAHYAPVSFAGADGETDFRGGDTSDF